ncbi:hypothetical protein OCU04_001729 [Sclerotinia nivalis]|uniref:Glycosyl transferase CAP10 domain-containing protein n=1 Tax=Sclerotinia nivalis TaxID=352851 RepID=A0A9X0AZT5_9HELO|nr:hypothetical protein OCU04_001729 [Sclerotinia nivalis]
MLHSLNRAIITSPGPLPNIEFSFDLSDIADPNHAQRSIWTLTRNSQEQEKWLMSDYGFWSWPLNMVGENSKVRGEIFKREKNFFDKTRKVIWRRAVKTNIGNLLRITAGKEWADVRAVRWAGASKLKIQDAGNALSMSEHCQYQFVLQTEGRSYSGRGKYLQNCNSVIIIPKRTWVEPHHSPTRFFRSSTKLCRNRRRFLECKRKS